MILYRETIITLTPTMTKRAVYEFHDSITVLDELKHLYSYVLFKKLSSSTPARD